MAATLVPVLEIDLGDRVSSQSTAWAHELWLVRHGETEWSRDARHTGRTDIPLTDRGRAQATLIKQVLARHSFARVLTSPLGRAVETCSLAGLGGDAERVQDLCEWDYGTYEGRTTREIRDAFPAWSLWIDGAPAGENPEDVGRRADRVVADVRRTNGDVAIFGHGHNLRVLTARWLGLTPDVGRFFALSTAAVSILGFERETPVILRWNEQPHDHDHAIE